MIERKFLENSSYNYLGDYMKLFYKIVKKLCIGIFSIYSINILFSLVNIVIPINIYTIGMSSFLGIFGIMGIITMKFIL